jgi:hypothetical protein
MNFRFIRSISLMGLALAITTTGCLKDKLYDNGDIQSLGGSNIKVISLGVSTSNAANFITLAYDNSNTDTTVNLFAVELGGPSAAPTDIHVTLGLADSLVDNLNNSNAQTGNGPSDYVVPTKYTLLNPVVTIPKGSRQAYVQIKFVPSDLIGVDYAIGFVIKSVQESGYTVSGNLNTGVVSVIIKNKWDGLYNVHGFFQHPSLGGPFVYKNLPVSTSGPNSVDMYAQPYSGGLLGAYPRLTVDPATNKVTVTSYDPGLTFSGPNQAGYPNRYDPATKTFFINYGYTTSAPREAWDTLVYAGAR